MQSRLQALLLLLCCLSCFAPAVLSDEKPAGEKPADEKPTDEKPTDEKPTDEKPAVGQPAKAETTAKAYDPKAAEPAPLAEGHSGHGEVFNEGPRQAAYLMNDVGKVDFPATSKSEEAKAFVVQGIAQLHGFWYF